MDFCGSPACRNRRQVVACEGTQRGLDAMMLRRLRPEEGRDRHMHQARVEPLDRSVREGGVLRGQSAESPGLQQDVGRSEEILEGGEAGGGGEVEGDGALVGIEVEVVEAELVGRCCPLRGGAGSGTEAGEAMMGGSTLGRGESAPGGWSAPDRPRRMGGAGAQRHRPGSRSAPP